MLCMSLWLPEWRNVWFLIFYFSNQPTYLVWHVHYRSQKLPTVSNRAFKGRTEGKRPSPSATLSHRVTKQQNKNTKQLFNWTPTCSHVILSTDSHSYHTITHHSDIHTHDCYALYKTIWEPKEADLAADLCWLHRSAQEYGLIWTQSSLLGQVLPVPTYKNIWTFTCPF